MSKYLLLLLSFFLMANALVAQTGTLTGVVTTSSEEPVAYATVALKGTVQGAITDAKGHFVIENLAPGTFTLLVSSIGYDRQNREILITAGQPTQVTIALSPGLIGLQTVGITGRREVG